MTRLKLAILILADINIVKTSEVFDTAHQVKSATTGHAGKRCRKAGGFQTRKL